MGWAGDEQRWPAEARQAGRRAGPTGEAEPADEAGKVGRQGRQLRTGLSYEGKTWLDEARLYNTTHVVPVSPSTLWGARTNLARSGQRE